MIVIEGLKDGPVKGKSCILTLFAEGGVIQHFEDKSVIVGKWKVLETHGWQTGTPTEDGWYLLHVGCNIPFRVAYMRKSQWLSIDDSKIRTDTVISWQKIELY